MNINMTKPEQIKITINNLHIKQGDTFNVTYININKMYGIVCLVMLIKFRSLIRPVKKQH